MGYCLRVSKNPSVGAMISSNLLPLYRSRISPIVWPFSIGVPTFTSFKNIPAVLAKMETSFSGG